MKDPRSGGLVSPPPPPPAATWRLHGEDQAAGELAGEESWDCHPEGRSPEACAHTKEDTREEEPPHRHSAPDLGHPGGQKGTGK